MVITHWPVGALAKTDYQKLYQKLSILQYYAKTLNFAYSKINIHLFKEE